MGRLTADLREFLKLLISHRVRFVVVGGHAVAFHARPRYTKDLDVFVAAGAANARRLRAALVDFGFGSVAPTVAVLGRPGKVFMLGRPPSRIDVLTEISGVTFEAVWRGRRHTRFAGLERIPFIGAAHLIANKRAAGRLQDLADIEAIDRARLARARKRARKPRR
jgi:hypothetical protein